MDILQELDKAGVVYLDRHFIYTSGKHGSGYINLDPIYTIRWFPTFAAS